MRSVQFRGLPGSSVTAIEASLALPPGAENDHDAERAEDRQQHAHELHAFRDLPEPVVRIEDIEHVPEGGQYNGGNA